MTSAADAEARLTGQSEAALTAMAAGQGAVTARIAAVRELARRRAPAGPRALASLLAEPAAPPELRSAAASALAAFAPVEAEQFLEPGLRAGEPEIVRRSALALGRAGGPRALATLQAVPMPGDPAARRALGFARNLIAYRHGLTGERLAPVSRGALLPLPEAGAQSLSPTAMTAEAARGLAAAIERDPPGVAVAIDGGAAMVCGGNHLALLPARNPGPLTRASAVPAILFRQPSGLHDYGIVLYILSHPVSEGALALFGLRPDGTLTHAGQAEVAGREARFRVQALDTPHSPPFVIEGMFDLQAPRLSVTRAQVAPARAPGQVRPRVPTRDPR